MKLSVTGRQMAVTETIRQDIDKRLRRLERVLNDSAVSAQCVVARERGAYLGELTVHARGDHILHGVGRHARLPAAIGAAFDKVTQQAHKLTDRWKTRRKGGRPTEAGASPAEPIARAATPPRVIRTGPPAVKPMSLDDAMLALTSSDRPFFVFRHAPSDAVAILFRRPDGHFGLIEPEA